MWPLLVLYIETELVPPQGLEPGDVDCVVLIGSLIRPAPGSRKPPRTGSVRYLGRA